jgi:hydroxyacylglutathione hydrolase
LIEGDACYLIDSGMDGSEKAVFSYMEETGQRPEEIKGIFLTHAHPDYIGSASRIREMEMGPVHTQIIPYFILYFPINNFRAKSRV